jgi:hypothetical protein
MMVSNELGVKASALLKREFPIPLDDETTRIATVTVFMGSVLIRFAGWTTLGWATVALGIVTFWLAHQLAVAPCYDESTARL